MPDGKDGETRLPTGSRPINQTPWSGDHPAIKLALRAKPTDNVFIDPDDNVWLESPDGTYSNHGPASDYVGSGKPKGRRGKDRTRRARGR